MYRLMLVEDETIIRKGIKNGFDWNQLGFDPVFEASNGKKAMEILDALSLEELPDIVLLDIQMPVMNGIELMRIMSQKYPNIKVVILSGYGEFNYAQQAINYGAISYILKPTKKAEIEDTFKKVKTILDADRQEDVPNTQIRIDPVAQKITDYMNENFCKKVTLELLAENLFINPTYLSTLFKQKMGKSFKTYVITLRIEKAKHLLRETDLKIYDIASLVGYDDFRYFSKLFKSVTGVNTLEYRNAKDVIS